MISFRTLKRWGTSSLLFGLLALPAADRAAADALLDAAEGGEIQTAFGAYKAAILEDDGEKAADLVTQNTIDYFSSAKEMALYSTPAEILKHSLTDRMQIAFFRQRIPVETLQELSPREIFVYAVDRGWVGKNSVTPVSLGELTLTGDKAEAPALVNGEAVPFNLHFAKEEGAWKLDLVPLLAVGDAAFHQVAEQRGITGDELILQFLSAASGQEVTSEIWQPLLQRKAAN